MTSDVERRRDAKILLESLAEELDVPPSKYRDAQSRYDAVGGWLKTEGSLLVPYEPAIFPQGSFALGTAVKPIGDSDYDVDAVCLLEKPPRDIRQPELKRLVGDQLRANKTYAAMLDPKEGRRRCWTLRYADESKFHLDVCPAIPDEYSWLIALGVPPEYAKHAVRITDKETWDTDPDWPRGNPKGFAGWFKGRMKVVLEEARLRKARQMLASIEKVPDHEVRTPLQQIVQLLKRNRDVAHGGDEDRPASIIITTLAALAYDNEPDLLDALLNVLPRMRAGIERRGSEWWVPNPVNPLENFADRWAETPRKKDLFLSWLSDVERGATQLLTEEGFEKAGTSLGESFGRREASAALAKFAGRPDRSSGGSVSLGRSMLAAGSERPRWTFSVAHRENPERRWYLVPRYTVSVAATASRNGFRSQSFRSDSAPLLKQSSLRFEMRTDAPHPYEVFWQVVNTGSEAERHGGLRGNIFAGDDVRRESTLYSGRHWVECFVVKDGTCVGRSGEFIVNIE